MIVLDNSNLERITSVKEYIEAIFDLRISDAENYSLSTHWFFRGQKNSQWHIYPNVFRDDFLTYEFAAIDAAIRQRPFDFRECSTKFEILTKLQHYCLGTRLLDVTLNPLVALYFASEECEEYVTNKDGGKDKVNRDGKITYRHGTVQKLSKMEVRIACAIPFIDFGSGITLSDFCSKLERENAISSDELRLLEKNNYKEFTHIMAHNSFVLSPHSNERLARQCGAFLIPMAIKLDGESDYKGNYFVRKLQCNLDKEFNKQCFIIPSENKEQIREELDFLNINEATLFPELEHQLKYLRNKKKYTNPLNIEIAETFSGELHSQ